MEKKKRRGSGQSEGDAATVSSGVEPTLCLLSPPRKRAASLACPTPPALLQTQTHEDAGVLRITSSDSRIAMDRQNESGPAMPIVPTTMQGLDEPVLGQANPIAAASSLDMTLALQHQGDTDNNRAMVWSLEQNLPPEAFLPRLLRAYDSFHERYTRMKARKVDVEAQFEEQRRSHERFQQVADGYIQDLCSENQELRKTVDAAEKRIKWLESLLCQKDEFRACSGSREEALPNANCEADFAVSPVRPLTPTSDEVGAEGALRQMEMHLPSEPVREQRGGEVAECGEESSAPIENTCNREDLPREIEMAQDTEGPQEIVVTQESEGLQMLTQGNVVLRENELVQGGVEPCSLEGEHQLTNTQTSSLETYASNQVPESPVPEPLLGNSLEDARCPEELAPGDLDNAIVVCSEPVIPCRSNGAGFQDLHRKHVELLDVHQKEVAGLLSEVEILQEVLGYFIEMTVVSDKIGRMRRDKPTLILLHPKTGFRFRLEILKVPVEQLEAAKTPELSYKNLSLGTLIGVAPWWMKEEIVFTVDQLVNFLKKFQETLTGIPNNQRLVLDSGLRF